MWSSLADVFPRPAPCHGPEGDDGIVPEAVEFCNPLISMCVTYNPGHYHSAPGGIERRCDPVRYRARLCAPAGHHDVARRRELLALLAGGHRSPAVAVRSPLRDRPAADHPPGSVPEQDVSFLARLCT